MSAILTPSANDLPPKPDGVRWEPLTLAQLDNVLAIENVAYTHPWTRGNFIDALASGYEAQLLWAGNALLGYFIAMRGVDEAHLLNITVAPRFQRQGWARWMLQTLAHWARGCGAQWLWLEVRASNLRAQNVYVAYGFRSVGERKRYYPGLHGQREDAIVMSMPL